MGKYIYSRVASLLVGGMCLGMGVWQCSSKPSEQRITQKIDSLEIQLRRTQAAKIDLILKHLADQGKFAGLVILYVKGRAFLQQSYCKTAPCVQPDTPLRLPSADALMLRLAILHLITQQKLRFDTPLHTIFPKFPYAGVRVWHLLQHTSGLPQEAEILLREPDALPEKVLNILERQRPKADAAPGARYMPNALNDALLQLLLERITAKPWADFASATLYTPLAMRNTRYRQDGVRYLLEIAPQDVSLWAEAWESNRLLNDEVREVALSPTPLLKGVVTGQGIGWQLGSNRQEYWTLIHEANATLWYYYDRADKILVVLASDMPHTISRSRLTEICTMVCSILHQEAYSVPE